MVNNEAFLAQREGTQWKLNRAVRTEGNPPDGEGSYLMPDFDPRSGVNGAPHIYRGPTIEQIPYGSEAPRRILDRNGQVMAEFPPGTRIDYVGSRSFPNPAKDSSSDPKELDAFLRSDFYTTENGSEGRVLEVQLPPERLYEGDRVLVSSDPLYLIVSVDRQGVASRQNIPFPPSGIWQDEEIDDLPKPDNSDATYEIYFDLLKSGGFTYVVKSVPFFPEDGSIQRVVQTVYWDADKNEWILLQDQKLQPGNITKLSNGALLVDGMRVDPSGTDASDRLYRGFYLYEPKGGKPGLTLVRQWQLEQEFPKDFVLSPDGQKLFVVDMDPAKFDYERSRSGFPDLQSIYMMVGSEPNHRTTLDEQLTDRSETLKIADLPPLYNGNPRIIISPDGNTVAVMSQYSESSHPIIDGVETVPDYRTIHNRVAEHPITAAMLTVVKKGADGRWHTHHVAVPEGWGIDGRYLLSWDTDGVLKISQFDNTKHENEAWSHHLINTSTLETGILPYETFFVTNPENAIFTASEKIIITDSNGRRREFIFGVQPDGNASDRLESNISRAQDEGFSMWFTYDSPSETLNYGLAEPTLGFAGDWIAGKPAPLVGVVYRGPKESGQISPLEQATQRRHSRFGRLFGAFE